MNCKPKGYKVLVTDIEKAANIMIEDSKNRRINYFEKRTNSFLNKLIKNLFNETNEQTIERIYKKDTSTDFKIEDWVVKHYSRIDWGRLQLSAIKVVQEDFVWLDAEDSSLVSLWLNQKITPINNILFANVDVLSKDTY